MKQSTLHRVSSILCAIALILWVGCGKDDASSKYNEEVAKIKSSGEPTTNADWNTWHKAVPTEKNSALAYLEARKSLPTNWAEFSKDYQKAYAKSRRSKNFNPSALRIPPSLLPSVRAQLVAHNVQINQLLNLYATSPANQPARFPVDWNNGMTTELPHLAWLKGDVNLLVMRSRIYADAGNAGEAVRSILAAHRLAHLLNGEPSLISVLVQQALYSITDVQIERLLNQFALNDAQLVALHQSIASFNVPGRYANAVIGERCMGIATEEIARNGSADEIQRIDKHGEMLKEKLIQQLKNRSVADRDLDMMLFLELHNSLIKLFKSGYPQLPASHEKYNENVKTEARISEINELINDKSNSKYIISQMLGQSLTRFGVKDGHSRRW